MLKRIIWSFIWTSCIYALYLLVQLAGIVENTSIIMHAVAIGSISFFFGFLIGEIITEEKEDDDYYYF